KSLFFGNKGFASHQHIASGDDDLFIGEVIKRNNFAVCLAPDRTVSNPETTWRGWLRQKGRHLTTSVHYKGAVKVPLGLISMSQILFFGLFNAVLILHPLHWWVWGAFALRVLSQMVIFSFVTKKLGDRDLLWLTPFLEAILLLIYPIFALSNLIVKRNTWRT
ncbi:MAG: glycosyl transferase family 2, partial [Bacteroidota bacterium]